MTNDILGLYGPEDSKYLRLVARRAAENGIKTAWVAGPTPGCVAYVADTDAGWPLWDLSPEEDVDRIQHPGLSCCAAGVSGIMAYLLLVVRWLSIQTCIVGRGHAVQGLAEALDNVGWYVDQCSSSALDLGQRVAWAGIVVNSAREVSTEVLEAVGRDAFVLDVSGGMKELENRVQFYMPKGNIGVWNIAELLRRVRERIEEAERDG